MHNVTRGALTVLLLSSLLLTPPVVAQETVPKIETMAQAINMAQGFKYGDEDVALAYIRAEVIRRQQKPEARNELANLLGGFLDDPGSTNAFKAFVCKQLYLIGGEEQIGALLPMLLDPDLAHLARYALEVVPSPTADTALWSAFPKVDGKVAVGIISSLAARRGEGAVARMVTALSHENPGVVRAALIGLGKLGGVEAEVALQVARKNLAENLEPVLHEALIACADGYAYTNQPEEANRLYRSLLVPEFSTAIRLAAFRGLVDLLGPTSTALLMEALASGDPAFLAPVCGYIRTVGGSDATVAFASQLGVHGPEVDYMLIEALADRGDPLALDAILSMSGSGNGKVQSAVLAAVGSLGNETHVPLLVDALVVEEDGLADDARSSLLRMADAGVDGALLRYIDIADVEVQTELMGVLADRRATTALPALLSLAMADVGEVRVAALKGAGQLAQFEEIPRLFEVYLVMPDEASRTEAARALAAAFRRVPPSDLRTGLLLDCYDRATTAVTKSGLLGIFRELGDDSLLPLILAATDVEESIERDAGIDALVQWPTATPLTDLMALANDGVQKNAVLGGVVRMIRLPSDRSPEASLAGLEDVLRLSNDADIVRRVLAALAELKSTAALDLAESLLGREDLRKDAAIAAEKIRRNFYTVTASINQESAPNVNDSEVNTFWDTGASQVPGQWIEIDMSRSARIKGVVLDNSRSKENFPRAYLVHVYKKGTERGIPVSTGTSTEGVTTIYFPPVVGQLVRIELTAAADVGWRIHEIRVVPD